MSVQPTPELTIENLVNALTASSSTTHGLDQKLAENALQAWEKVPGYAYLLQSVYFDKTAPLEVQWLAVICFKNQVERFWRKSRPNSITPEEKTQIRNRIFECLAEPNKQLFIQCAHATARMARLDFPADWPNLFEDLGARLVAAAANSDILQVKNVLTMLNEIIKILATVRIGRSRTSMQENAPKLMTVVVDVYTGFFAKWTDSPLTEDSYIGIEVAYMALKVLRKLLIEGFEAAHRSKEAVDFFNLTVEQLQFIVEIRASQGVNAQQITWTEKYIKAYGKMFDGLFVQHPLSFVRMPTSLSVLSCYMAILETHSQGISQYDEDSVWTKMTVTGLLLVKRATNFVYKRGAVKITMRKKEDQEEMSQASVMLRESFFKDELVIHLCELIVKHYLQLSKHDLETWNSDPEEFISEEMSQSWEHQLRPCAENVFTDLLVHFKDLLCPRILELVQYVSANNVDEILLKDAAYSAFGLGASVLADYVDFDQILTSVLIPEAQQGGASENRIIRRRVCVVISDWVSVKCSAASRLRIYDLLLQLMDSSDPLNDIVVRLSAVLCLRYSVDDWEFKADDFVPYMPRFLAVLMREVQEAENLDSKLRILGCMAILIDQMKHKFEIPNELLQSIPKLWHESENNHSIKGTLMDILKNLLVALYDQSYVVFNVCAAIINMTCSRSSPLFAFLNDDGFDLWLALVENSFTPTEEVLSLVPLLMTNLKDTTENLDKIVHILTGYFLLAPEYMLDNFAGDCFATLATYIGGMKDNVLHNMCEMLGYLVALVPTEKLGTALVVNELFKELVLYVATSDEYPIASINVLNFFSRLTIANCQLFIQMLQNNFSPVEYMGLIKMWTERFENMGDPKIRKLNILGLTALLRVNDAEILNLLPKVLALVAEFLEEVNEDNGIPLTYYSKNDYTEGEVITPQSMRIKHLNDNDVIFNTSLKDYAVETLRFLNDSFPQQFAATMSQLDRAVFETLQMKHVI